MVVVLADIASHPGDLVPNDDLPGNLAFVSPGLQLAPRPHPEVLAAPDLQGLKGERVGARLEELEEELPSDHVEQRLPDVGPKFPGRLQAPGGAEVFRRDEVDAAAPGREVGL